MEMRRKHTGSYLGRLSPTLLFSLLPLTVATIALLYCCYYSACCCRCYLLSPLLLAVAAVALAVAAVALAVAAVSSVVAAVASSMSQL